MAAAGSEVSGRFADDQGQTQAESGQNEIKHAEKDEMIRHPPGNIPGQHTVDGFTMLH